MPESFTDFVGVPIGLGEFSNYALGAYTYRDTTKASNAVQANGGAHSRSVTVVLNPIVAHKVGK